ncbi:MAG TPA: FG-GAP-like repeat-containing protein, partial [Blastocatellia bacterium]|nr:FG-GAP-like repeat-containing protein [Blastocatellia bacterium]
MLPTISHSPVTLTLAILWMLLGAVWQPPTTRRQDRPASPAEEQLRRGRALFDERRFAEAAVAARLARESDPSLIAAWKLGGLALQLSQQLPAAEQELAAALKLFPADADLWFYLARVQYLESSLKSSEQSARRALELQDEHADAHTQLAMTLDARHDDSNALTHYVRAIELNRKQQRAQTLPLVYAGQLLARLGRDEEALDYLTRAVNLNPRSSETLLARGRVLERLGRRAEAEQAYREALAVDGNQQARSALDRLRAGPAAVRLGAAPAKIGPVRFRNAAASAGLNFVLRNGATPRKYQVEAMTGGVAVIDYDRDGWEDLYFVNGAELPGMKKTSPSYWNRLYRNNRNGTFTDVTEQAGVAGEGYSMGVAVGDYDNDGDQDLFVAGVNRNLLYRNDGHGRFTDVTVRSGLTGVDPQLGKMWSVAAAWLDFDHDGDLDLFVVNYCKWSPDLDPYCGARREGWRSYCYPDKYEGLPNQFFLNNGDGTFTDLSVKSGISRWIGKGMGVATADYDDDGLIDLLVANDTLPNFLFRNNGRGGFDEVALTAGVALNDTGRPISSMGVDLRDYDNDGLPDLIVSALEGETFPLLRNFGKGFFADVTWPSGIGPATVRRSGWGLGLYDFNNDGFKDLFTANSHVNDNIELYNEQTYRQSNSLLVNQGNGTFTDVTASAGDDFQAKRAHRGCAFADFDHDGKIDVVTTSLNEPAELFLNQSPDGPHWLTLRLIGVRSNRAGLGVKVKLVTPSGARQFNQATTSVGYASSSSPWVHFGLGSESRVQLLEIRWPSGATQVLRDLQADRVLEVREE